MDEKFFVREFEQVLSCPMTKDELVAACDELATQLVELEEQTADMAETVKALKDENTRRKEAVSVMARRVRSRKTDRAVTVREYLTPDGKSVEGVRTDTGEVVSTRPADMKERNKDLFPGPEGASADA